MAGGGVVLMVQMLQDLLYGVALFDPITLTRAVVVLLVCAGTALFAPVRRATRADPAVALRAE